MSQMIAGWPGQGMYNGCLLTGAYLAFRILLSQENGVLGWRDRLVRLVGDSAGVLTFALLWAAAGILPRIDIVSRTNVAWGEYDGFETNSYASGWQIYTVLDRLFTDNNGYRSLLFYLGAPVIILMIIGVVLAWRRPWVQFMTGVTILTSIMTLKPTFIHEIVFLLPRYEALHSHVPSRILAVQWIGPVVLAATALDALMRSPVAGSHPARGRDRVRHLDRGGVAPAGRKSAGARCGGRGGVPDSRDRLPVRDRHDAAQRSLQPVRAARAGRAWRFC